MSYKVNKSLLGRQFSIDVSMNYRTIQFYGMSFQYYKTTNEININHLMEAHYENFGRMIVAIKCGVTVSLSSWYKLYYQGDTSTDVRFLNYIINHIDKMPSSSIVNAKISAIVENYNLSMIK